MEGLVRHLQGGQGPGPLLKQRDPRTRAGAGLCFQVNPKRGADAGLCFWGRPSLQAGAGLCFLGASPPALGFRPCLKLSWGPLRSRPCYSLEACTWTPISSVCVRWTTCMDTVKTFGVATRRTNSTTRRRKRMKMASWGLARTMVATRTAPSGLWVGPRAWLSTPASLTPWRLPK